MAKRRSKKKKRQRRLVTQQSTGTAPAQRPGLESAELPESALRPDLKAAAPDKAPAPVVVSVEFAYVKTEVKFIALLAAGFVLLQLVLWYLFNHTNLGQAVYKLFSF